MTRIQRDGKPQSPFSEWIRSEPDLDSRKSGVSVMDIDWIWHQYRIKEDKIGKRTINHIMLIEEKPNGKDLEFSQRDTMFLMDQLFKYIDKINNLKWRTVRGEKVSVRYWGYFALRYEGLSLPDATWIKWNKRLIDLDILKKILLFEISPKTLEPYSERRHHPSKENPLLSGLEATL